MDNNIEKDVIKALDTASIDYKRKMMEDINPADFKVPEKAMLKRVKKNVMKQMNTKKAKQTVRWERTISVAFATVAIIGAIIVLSASNIRVKAVEALKKVFAFIPGEGIVETQVDKEAGDKLSNDGIYILDGNAEASNNDLSVKMVNVKYQGDTLDIQYTVNLSKIKNEDIETTLTKANNQTASEDGIIDSGYLSAFADLYKKYGYDEYFEINDAVDDNYSALKEPKACIEISGKQYESVSYRCMLSEEGFGKKLYVYETFNMAGCSLDKSCKMALAIGNLKVPFAVKATELYDSVGDLEEHHMISKGDIKFIVEPEWNGSELKIELYPIDLCGFTQIDQIRCSVDIGGAVLVGMISEEYVPGSGVWIFEWDTSDAQSDANPIFRIDEAVLYDETNEMRIEINGDDYGEIQSNGSFNYYGNAYGVESLSIIKHKDAINEYDVPSYFEEYNIPGDCVEVKLKKDKNLSDGDSDLSYYNTWSFLVNDSKEVPYWEKGDDIICIFTEMPKEEIKSVTFKGMAYLVNDILEMEIER